ncbi:MAG: hypothetical protein A3A97_04810 [Candidatus Terrybacteria bacterium RIFCSPLOWO2_01_FULL_40_23]|uniref:Uncharacterized protein n=1 Tax=Candidatus Terrybacteria bacterium RIFCSPLOWO2_01_FULL_40_23 TaxID=1802366 RepID=A0A1G2PV46_9BACT|nr:MAG: hypothetical protein A3A97_04810 [Candidatus Terrybacteria bacterium RIFCSPLOWO2_01_FULL_40_23]
MNVLSRLNIASDSGDWRARRLSNLSDDPFILDGVRLASVEGFIQGIKFPVGDPLRKLAFLSVGMTAKRLSRQADRQSRWVWWNGREYPYGAFVHHKLIERAIRAKFEQNARAMKALLGIGDSKLVHELGHSEGLRTSLPATVFCDILTRIREETSRAVK